MISPSLFVSSILKMHFMVLIMSFQSQAMRYEEPLNIDDLQYLLNEDGCVEGILSAAETGGGPVLKSVMFAESEHFTNLKSSDKNESSVFEDKSPMSLINELAVYNNIQNSYTLTLEEGPSHKKRFGISLKLGEEAFYAEGSSIKRAQHEAARLAINSTLYKHPPEKPKNSKPLEYKKTAVEQLNDWARKHGGASVKYIFTEQSKLGHSTNYYHKAMYSYAANNVHKVTVKFGKREYSGEGSSSNAAQQDAANKALKQLQKAEGFCMFEDSIKNILTKLFSSDSGNYSPISIVFEFASKSKLTSSFDLISEEGPAHIKKFVYKCSVGDNFETFGEGSSKRAAKTEAAENMVQKLKSHASYTAVNCDGPLQKGKKLKKRKPKNLIKSVINSYSEEEDISEYTFSDEINPISKLMEIQQKHHGVHPQFQLLEDRGKNNKEFFMEVKVGDVVFVGSGSNKKAAKKKAAEGMLEKLGYSITSGKSRSSFEHNKKEFFEDHGTAQTTPLVPGLNLNSKKISKFNDGKSSLPENEKSQQSSSNSQPNEERNQHSSPQNVNDRVESDQKKTSGIKAKTQLVNLAKELGFRLQFSDFPKGNSSEYVTLVSLTTDPPKVCYGTGLTIEHAQEKASLNALQALYKTQLNLVSKMLREPTLDSKKIGDLYLDNSEPILKPAVDKETTE